MKSKHPIDSLPLSRWRCQICFTPKDGRDPIAYCKPCRDVIARMDTRNEKLRICLAANPASALAREQRIQKSQRRAAAGRPIFDSAPLRRCHSLTEIALLLEEEPGRFGPIKIWWKGVAA